MSDETIKNDDKPWLFKEGNEGGPGRPKDDEKAKLTKRAIKELVKEYKEDLAQILPDLKPILIDLAKKGDMTAIKEIHDRVMDKSKQPTDITSDGEKIVPIYGGGSSVISNEERYAAIQEHNRNQENIQPEQTNPGS